MTFKTSLESQARRWHDTMEHSDIGHFLRIDKMVSEKTPLKAKRIPVYQGVHIVFYSHRAKYL